jgi:hypothetical protein
VGDIVVHAAEEQVALRRDSRRHRGRGVLRAVLRFSGLTLVCDGIDLRSAVGPSHCAERFEGSSNPPRQPPSANRTNPCEHRNQMPSERASPRCSQSVNRHTFLPEAFASYTTSWQVPDAAVVVSASNLSTSVD